MKKNRNDILRFIKNSSQPVPFRDLMAACGVSKRDRRSLGDLVDNLVAGGDLVKLKGNRYAPAADLPTVKGRLSLHRDGYGFVAPDEGGADLFIPTRFLRESMPGDRVEVRVLPAKPDGRREGRVVATLERGARTVVGTYRRLKQGGGMVVPSDDRPGSAVAIPASLRSATPDGEVVVAEITAYPTERLGAVGRIVEVLGSPDDPEVEILTIIRKHGLPDTFPPDTLEEAQRRACPPAEADLAGRTDLRGIPTVTIDGETARDFDDAVAVRREGGGKVRLWVSIADVSYYVTPGSPLDREAYLRGTSVYFPDRCIPMLPEELSNGICSLVPGEDRLTMTAELLFDANGGVCESSFYPSVIRSAARLTYTLVEQIVVAQDEAVMTARAALVPDLLLMKELALRLTAVRQRRGSIDFDLPEPEIIMGATGEIEAIIRSTRLLAHRIIEEFMLAANEAVATVINRRTIPSLYRVHEPPDPAKLEEFREFIQKLGYRFPEEVSESGLPGALQRLLDEAAGKPEERMINEVLLRCMKQARYSAENDGHFGLASPCYTHFTSPIRRYPDLVVHRILRRLLADNLPEQYRNQLAEELPVTAAHTSRRERVAMEAERECVDLKKAQFMLGRLGDVYDGIITGVAQFGFFVELTEFFVEGMVPVALMRDDYYEFQEKEYLLVGVRTGRRFRIGDETRVRVVRVDIERRRIEFAPEGDEEGTGLLRRSPASNRKLGAARKDGARKPPRRSGRKKSRHAR